MSVSTIIALTLLAVVAVVVVNGDGCVSPSVTTNTYTTKHLALSSQTAYLAQFNVQCKNEDVTGSLNLYAEVEAGVLVPVAVGGDGDDSTTTYQVSWVVEHKNAVTGDIPINVYDEEGFTAYRKAQRTEGGDVSSVAALFTVNVNHPGATKDGLFVQSEFIAVVCVLAVWWCANNIKTQILS